MAPQSFRPQRGRRYLALFKPYAMLSQFSQPENSEKSTLASLALPANVYPIGRLDFDSEGLLLLSDDPALNQALLHPSRGHRRTYLAQVEKIPDHVALATLEQGVVIEGTKSRPAQARLLPDEPTLPPRPVPVRFRKNIPTAWIELTLTEGKNRQVRKMTAAVGHPTLRLMRISIGALSLETLKLKPGQWVELDHTTLMLAFA